MKIAQWHLRGLGPTTSAGVPKLNLSATGPEIALLRGIQALLMAATVCSLGLAWWWWDNSVADEAAAAQIEGTAIRIHAANERLQQSMVQDGLTLTAEQLSGLKEQVAFANLLSAKRRLSWARLLSDLDAATPMHISFSSVHLNFQDTTVSLQGASSSLQDLHALVSGLNKHPAFSKAILSSHTIESSKDMRRDAASDNGGDVPPTASAVKRVIFTMTALYTPVL